jgi:PIN domain nuclease of toxin-antitoxin system
LRYLLDTHAWIWLVEAPTRLSRRARQELDQSGEVFAVADISLWEIAQKAVSGDLGLREPVDQWLARAAGHSHIRVLSITPAIAWEQAQLPGDFHRDPADRLIVATARVHQLTLVTKDERIQRYPHVPWLW